MSRNGCGRTVSPHPHAHSTHDFVVHPSRRHSSSLHACAEHSRPPNSRPLHCCSFSRRRILSRFLSHADIPFSFHGSAETLTHFLLVSIHCLFIHEHGRSCFPSRMNHCLFVVPMHREFPWLLAHTASWELFVFIHELL